MAERGRDLEGDGARVHLVEVAVVERDDGVDHREPISTPASHTDCTPLATPGMYSLGTTPPTTSLSKSLPLPGSLALSAA
jgi:hypothetical protein